MSIPRFFTLLAALVLAPSLFAERQPLITHFPEGENVRVAYVYDLDRNVDGDDYHGFTVTYASKIYPLDQMLVSYTRLAPENATMQQVMFSIEEYYQVSDSIIPYGAAGAGYAWIDYDRGAFGVDDGWVAKLAGGLLFKTGTRFDLYAELSYQFSSSDLWLDGSVASRNNNTQAVVGVRMNY